MEVAADLLMDAHHVRACLGEVREKVVGILDHEVAVERELRHPAQGLDHGRPEGNVRHEVAVHDVDVDDGSAAALGCCNFVGEVREVGGQDGECQFDQGVAPG